MESSSLIYVDESGNDGPNYLNEDAPFYVLAGWVVPEIATVDVTVEMETLRKAHCPRAAELKFKTFRGKPWAVSECLCRLGKLGLVPVYLIAEKRFCVAAKIIETFLDPYYNSKLSMGFTSDIITKQELANTLYDRLSEAALRRFAEAYRSPTQADFEQALEVVSRECCACVNPEVAELIEGSRPKLAEIAQDEVNAVNSWGKGMATLNLPCLISFLMLIEELGRKGSIRPKKIVHDEQGPYQEDYRRIFDLHRQANSNERVLLNGMRVPYGAIRSIEEFEIQRSVDQPLLQAADLLAGSIAHLSGALIQGRQLQPQEIELGGLLFPAMLLGEIALAMPVCSDRMLKRIGSAIRQAYPETPKAIQKEADDRWPFRWTSTVSDGGPLPVLPAPRNPTIKDRVADHTFTIDLPLFGLANDSANQLVVLLPSENRFDETSVYERCVPLWTRRELAKAFLEDQDWSEPHHVVEFGPKEIPDLINQLREQSQWVEMVGFNLIEDPMPYPITRLADEMERIWDRCIRAARAGVVEVLFKKHEIGGHEVSSTLVSSGEYVAMRMSDGLRVAGATREEAILKLTAAMKADRTSGDSTDGSNEPPCLKEHASVGNQQLSNGDMNAEDPSQPARQDSMRHAEETRNMAAGLPDHATARIWHLEGFLPVEAKTKSEARALFKKQRPIPPGAIIESA